MTDKTEKELLEQFAYIYIDGSACNGCKYENYATCCDRYRECAERIKEVLNDR